MGGNWMQTNNERERQIGYSFRKIKPTGSLKPGNYIIAGGQYLWNLPRLIWLFTYEAVRRVLAFDFFPGSGCPIFER